MIGTAREANVVGQGSTSSPLTEEQARSILAEGLARLPLDGKRLLVIIPDHTRSGPIPLMFRLLNELAAPRTAQLDFLIALGTHQPMTPEQIARLIDCDPDEHAATYPKVRIFNHTWDEPRTLETLGTIPAREVEQLTGGLLAEEVPVTLNRLILDYDHLLICGPVFPHEVAGFSGGAKYLFPGIAGPEIINATHWLGALVTNMHTIGVKETPVRAVIQRAAHLVPRPVDSVCMVVHHSHLHGLYVGGHHEAWSAAADLSAGLDIVYLDRPVKRVLSMPALRYDDLWTAAKAAYKTEPVVEDGGEIVIYAPHLSEVSYTHGELIDATGYHVRDYFVKQPERFRNVPGMIKAHSTHVKGLGTYDIETGIETPRIQVTLATAIPAERCRLINLGYVDWREIDTTEWEGREAEGILVVHNAGEMLYRLRA